MYAPDLTPYTYHSEHLIPAGTRVLNVGWLDSEREYPKGDVPARFLKALVVLAHHPEGAMRGGITCPFCRTGYSSAEIRATHPDGTIYAAPHMVLHYVGAHDYKPPQDFVEAAMHTVSEKLYPSAFERAVKAHYERLR